MTLDNQPLPNDFHYLLINQSPYLWLDKRNAVKHSRRKLKATKTALKTRQFLDRYVILDAATGCVYAEYFLSRQNDAVYSFLYRAWQEKDKEFLFCGMPKALVVPKKHTEPALVKFLETQGIDVLQPESGFSSGIWILKRLTEFEYRYRDDGMWHCDSSSWPLNLETVNKRFYNSLVFENKLPKGKNKEPRREIWQSGINELRLPESQGNFLSVLDSDLRKRATDTDSQRHPPLKLVKKSLPVDREAAEKADRLFEEGMEYLWAGDTHNAMKLYREALKIDPGHIDAHHHIGNLLNDYYATPIHVENCYRAGVDIGRRMLGDIEPGEAWLDIENRPYMRALHGLGLMLEKKKDLAGALECYQELLRLNPPDNQGIRYLMGSVYHQMSDFEKAEEWYRQSDDMAVGAWNLVLLYFQQNKIEQAVEALLEAITINRHVIEEIQHPSWSERCYIKHISPAQRDEAISYVDNHSKLGLFKEEYRTFLKAISRIFEVKELLKQGRPTELSGSEIKKLTQQILAKLKLK